MAKRNSQGEIEEISPLQQSILLVLRRHPEGLYGLEVLKQVNSAKAKVKWEIIKMGSFYPTIKRLEEDGLVEGFWGDETTAGARRRYYRVTSAGSEAVMKSLTYFAVLQGEEPSGQIIMEF